MDVPREASGKGIGDLMRPDDLADLESAIAALARRAQRLRTALFWGVGPLAVTGTTLFAASFGPVNNAPVGSIGIVLIALACGVAVIGQLVWSRNLLGVATRGVYMGPLPDRAERLLGELRSGKAKAWLEPVRGAAGDWEPFGSLAFTGPFAPLTLSPEASVQALGRSPWASGATALFRFRVSEELEMDLWRDAEGTSGTLALHLPVPGEAREVPAGPFSRFLHLPSEELEAILRAAYPDFGTEHATHRSTIIVHAFLIANELVKSSAFKEVTALREAVIKRLSAIGLDNYSLRESGDAVSSSWMDKALSRARYHSIDDKLERAEAILKDRHGAQ
ncbi:MAG: hypothetical protein SNJ79_00500 [Sphingomonadaceae bacterium]